MSLKGKAKIGLVTKILIRKLNYNDIAIIDHKDIDEVAANSLVAKKVKAVINISTFISGKYPNQGPNILDNKGILMYEAVDKDILSKIVDNDVIEIIDNCVKKKGEQICRIKPFTANDIKSKMEEAQKNLSKELNEFIDNTLTYAKREKKYYIEDIQLPFLYKNIFGRHVLVVIRGRSYKEDLIAIREYINEVNPVKIGVDGGADALLELGFIPDIVIGDMDSVSDICLIKAKQIIVHAYLEGKSPGLDRVKKLGLKPQVFSFPGTSEDIALIVADKMGAELIVAVGSHSNMIDFLEKGRPGMASTFLVRLKIGTKLVDAKGVNKLYRSNIKLVHVFGLLVSALFPIAILIHISPAFNQIYKLLEIRFKIFFGL